MYSILNLTEEAQKILIEKAFEMAGAHTGEFENRAKKFEPAFAAMLKTVMTERTDDK